MLKRVAVVGILSSLVACATIDQNDRLLMVGKIDNVKVSEFNSKYENDVLVAHVAIANLSKDRPQDVYYRCHFYDKNAFDLTDETQWLKIIVYGGQTRDVTCISNSKEAIDFKIEVNSTGSSPKVYN